MKTNLNSGSQQFHQYLLVAYRASSTKEKKIQQTKAYTQNPPRNNLDRNQGISRFWLGTTT